MEKSLAEKFAEQKERDIQAALKELEELTPEEVKQIEDAGFTVEQIAEIYKSSRKRRKPLFIS